MITLQVRISSASILRNDRIFVTKKVPLGVVTFPTRLYAGRLSAPKTGTTLTDIMHYIYFYSVGLRFKRLTVMGNFTNNSDKCVVVMTTKKLNRERAGIGLYLI